MMTQSKCRFLSFLVVLAAGASFATAACDIVNNGSSDYKILLQPGFSKSEKLAADELRNHIQQASGVKIPVITELPKDRKHLIVLGRGPISEEFKIYPPEGKLGRQGARSVTVNGNLFICGSKDGGTLNGVYRFLKDYVGVKWLAPNETKVPKRKNLKIPQIDKIVKPAFYYRDTTYYRGIKNDKYFAARKGRNYGGGKPCDELGEQIAFDGKCHSYYRYINPADYYDEHPGYFSEIGGKRIRHEAQLCLTNPKVLDIVTEKMLARIKANPNLKQYNFSQMDFYNYCQCDKCKAINEKYQTTGGTQFWFVNKLAERISKVYPDKLIGTLAYTFSEKPPVGMKMHPNVAVWLCHMFPSCDSHSIKSCPRNADYKKRVEQWSRICEHLYIWHYITDFAHFYNPFPNFNAIAEDLKFYRDNGVEGIFLQGKGNCSRGGEFSLLRPYYAMKLAWNPDQDPAAIMDEFLAAYYGSAAEPIRKYIDLLQNEVDDKNIHMHLYNNPAQGYLSDEIIAKSQQLFDEAENLVKDNAILLERVKVARMPLVYARLFPRNGYSINNNWLKMKGQLADIDEAKEFLQRMKSHGFDSIREHGGNRELFIPMMQMIRMPKKIIPLENRYLRLEIVPMLAGRILRIIDKKSGKCITSCNNIRSLFFPFCGGFENRIGESFFSWGWYMPGLPVKQTKDSVTVAIKTINGYKILRTVKLDAGKPVIDIQVEVTNLTEQALPTRLQNHLELDMKAFGGNIEYAFTDIDGRKIEHALADVLPGKREGKYYRDNNIPAGEWIFRGANGLSVKYEFELDKADFTWLVCYPKENEDFEINVWLKNQILKPGQSMAFKNRVIIESKDYLKNDKSTLDYKSKITGTISADNYQKIQPGDNPELSKTLKQFQVKPEAFNWTMSLKSKHSTYDVYNLQFPSAYKSDCAKNNVVHCEYYKAKGDQPKPTVIVLHALDGRFIMARLACRNFANAGINALMVQLPYYGSRKPANGSLFDTLLKSPKSLAKAVVQSVTDVRRAARWLRTRTEVNPNEISLTGISLGGFIAGTAAGVDGTFAKIIMIISGGDLAKVFEGSSNEVCMLRKGMDQQQWSKKDVRELLLLIDPLTFASRLSKTKVLMINATKDQIVPVECAKKFAQAANANQKFFPADHYTIAVFIPVILKQTIQHMKMKDKLPCTSMKVSR